MTVVVFNLFYLTHLLVGRGLILFLNNNFKYSLKLNDLKISKLTSYPVIAIFFVGNLSFIANFFIPVEVFIPYLFGIAIFLILYNFKENKDSIFITTDYYHHYFIYFIN